MFLYLLDPFQVCCLYFWLSTTSQGREQAVQHSYCLLLMSVTYSLLHQLAKLNIASPLYFLIEDLALTMPVTLNFLSLFCSEISHCCIAFLLDFAADFLLEELNKCFCSQL